jgi:ABC-2 type transport system permease protein
MNNLLLWAGDSATMLRRNLRRKLRHPSMTLLLVGEPIVLLLVFVYVFGGTLGAGLGDLSDAPPTWITSSPASFC